MSEHFYQEAPPPLWFRNPGDVGTLVWMGKTNWTGRRLPRSWSVEHLWAWSRVTSIDEPVTAVIVDPRGAAPREVEERIVWCDGQTVLRNTQILLVDSIHAGELLGLPNVRLLPSDSRPMGRRIHEEISRTLLVWLKRHLARRFGATAEVNQFLRRSLLQDVPSLIDVEETGAMAGVTYVRKVKDVADVLNWSRSYLYQHLPFRASDALRTFAFIHGLLLYCPDATPWGVVARRLGFYDAGNWNHFCNRVAGVSPSQLCERTRGEWIREVMRAGLDHDGGRRLIG